MKDEKENESGSSFILQAFIFGLNHYGDRSEGRRHLGIGPVVSDAFPREAGWSLEP
jgi:hypothetical protein